MVALGGKLVNGMPHRAHPALPRQRSSPTIPETYLAASVSVLIWSPASSCSGAAALDCQPGSRCSGIAAYGTSMTLGVEKEAVTATPPTMTKTIANTMKPQAKAAHIRQGSLFDALHDGMGMRWRFWTWSRRRSVVRYQRQSGSWLAG